MSLFSALVGGPVERKAVVSADALTWTVLSGAPAKSGVSVNLWSAVRCAAVFACCRVLAEGLAQMPLGLFRRQGKSRTEADSHWLQRLLTSEPNGWMTPFEFVETMTYHALLSHGGFAYKSPDTREGHRGEILELIPLIPGNVSVKQAADYTLTYDVALVDGKTMSLRQDEVFHIRGAGWSGYDGWEPLLLFRESIGLAIAAEGAHAALHANGGRPGGILTTDSKLDVPKKDKLRNEWIEKFGSTGRAFGLAVLDEGMKYQALAMTGVDSQHVETRKLQVEEICRQFRVFPQMVGYSDKTSTYASAEQFFIAHVVHSLGPWIARWEQRITRDLLPSADRRAGFYPKFIVQSLMRGDDKSRGQYFKDALGTSSSPGWMSPNDIRALEDMDPAADAAADRIITVDDLAGKPAPVDVAPAKPNGAKPKAPQLPADG